MNILLGGLRRVRRAAGGARDGYTFVELLVVAAIVLIMATAVLPLSKVGIQRQKEVELRRTLRELRTAIDRYKDAADLQQISNLEIEPDDMGYPPDLETLVKGVTKAGDATQTKLRFLRRIPVDPLTGDAEWGLRSYQDRPDSTSWGGQNVFDVYSKAGGTGLDGTPYSEW
ncbi:type II secretion system pseudopilin PulG [Luteitalea sp. TBR-22]|uniref:type II secretion system protein n=1 Tax=Luteitalea sp. TBR-22 TaxID=2802971 RepID=UPI001AF09F1E|nr:type II secretion system protein [Luteitalea sp. TBR-22]BCS33341.1 type II secretion system pseudopilin PulG [Luteitalea sp. TBR-22]